MKKIVLLILLYSLVNANENNKTSEYEKALAKKLFEKAFKKSSSTKKLYFPLNVNGILQDEVSVKIDSNENLFVKQETMEYIASLLKEKYKKAFKYNRVDKDGFTPLLTLNQFGILTKYNRDNIAIDVSIPPKIQKASNINFNRHRAVDLNGSILPEDYAGGINFYFNEYYKNNTKEHALTREPLIASSDIFLNINDFVLEGRVNYKESNSQFDRDRVRLVKDDEDNQIRYTIGDIFLPNQYRMSYREALGVTIEKKFEMGRDFAQNSSRVNSYEFFLKNSSRVEIYINDRLDKSLHLKAGTHNLYDLGIPNGLNQIKLKIIEDNGKIEFISFDDFSYSEILKQGTIKYGLGVGVSSKREDNKFIYDKQEKLISAYIDYGLFNSITTKCGIQASQDYQAVGLEFLIGTNFGFFDPYIIYSKTDTLQDNKKGLDYRTNIGNLNINLNYETTGENFRRLDNYKFGSNDTTTLYRANVYTPLFWGMNIGLSASQYNKKEGKEKKLGAKVYKRLFNTIDTRINFDSIAQEGRPKENTVYFTLEYRVGRERVSYNNYPNENRHQLSSNYSSSGRYGFSNTLEYDHSMENDKYYAQADLVDEKFKLDTTYSMNDNKNSDKKNQSLGVQFSTGVVFAGDTATITEPINSSFIIVKNDDKLEKPLGLDKYQDSDDYIYDSFALQIGDYNKRELSVDESELDFGIDLDKSIQSFFSNYKSGSVMDIKVKNIHSVKGILVDVETNKPIASKAFKLFNTQTGKKFMGFTNDNGKFTVEQADIGKYNVTLVKEEKYKGVAKFNFEIKENSENLINLGTIKIKMPKKKEIKKYLIFNKKK